MRVRAQNNARGRNKEMQKEIEELRFSKEASELQLRGEIKCGQPPVHSTPLADTASFEVV